MNILVVGSGGREHALAWRLAQSESASHVFIAPGNPGTSPIGTNLAIAPTDAQGLIAACREHTVELVVIGPEAPLVEGVADALRTAGIPTVGPSAAAAQLEGSKAFAKAFMLRHDIPTAESETFQATELAAALAYVRQKGAPIVVKASGLAAGKGVIIAATQREAEAAVRAMLEDAQFGAASQEIVIEAYLPGIEVSVFALCDGKTAVLLPEAKDYKRIGVGNTGLNTGGMGAVSPVPFMSDRLKQQVNDRILAPTQAGMEAEGIPFTGFLFLGLMLFDGEVYVLEYNVRLGDPETQAILPRLSGDFALACQAAATGTLTHDLLTTQPAHAATVVVVSGGYPEAYEKGHVITELPTQTDQLLVFHAGTRLTAEPADSRLETAGGRVLAFTALAADARAAQAAALQAAEAVQFSGKYYRTDIGQDLQPL